MKKTLTSDIIVLVTIILLFLLVSIPYLSVFLSFLLVIIYTKVNDDLNVSLGFIKQKNIVKTLLLAIVFALAINYIAYYALLNPIEKLTKSSLQLGPFSQLKGNFNVYLASIFIGWIVGGIFEEVIFRGFMISKSIKYFGNKSGAILGILLSSLFFGYLHSYQGITGQILTGFGGLMFGCIYVAFKRNLLLVILTHGFINTISLTLLYYGLLFN